MKVTAEQIEKLYVFTRQHYVEYYDLQTELVDHLANAIEEQWETNPKLTFEEALQIEFKKFGVFGFMDVVDKRKGALSSKYNKLVWNELKTFFRLPKIIGTLAAIGIVFYLLKFLQQDVLIVQMTFVVLAVSFFVGIFWLSRKNKKNHKKTGKKWLLKEIIFGYGSFTGLMNLPIQIALHIKGENYNDWALLLVSFLLIIMALGEYIVLVLIPSKAEEYLRETYPEYELIENM
ncbi:hypothetical protein EZL74_01725 [Flavobacterium silvisoli]|uniref:Uncharacterized protein n=1 Tax=Flavobacterium silvisoli TaxID=2529433 RepID=A0A4V2L5N9_9FLAO|nr:hypothetical protein [Flavobacterium silvisoli]TBX71251.1 hypothetical protein EZL74_01725 [Flavobacterium silvisoli]